MSRFFSIAVFGLLSSCSVFAADYQCGLSFGLDQDQVTALLKSEANESVLVSEQKFIQNERIQFPNPDAVAKVETTLFMRRYKGKVDVFVLNDEYPKNPSAGLITPYRKSVQDLSFKDGDRLNLRINLIDGADFTKTLPGQSAKLNCKSL